MRKRRFIVVSALYATAIPVTYALFGPIPTLIVAGVMLGSVGLALILAWKHEPASPRPPKPLSAQERRWFALARHAVLAGAIISLMTWASVWAFYWELRSYLLTPGAVSCIIALLAIYAILRPRSLSGNIMRFQMMVAFGYVLVLPAFVGWVLIARPLDIGMGPTIVLFVALNMLVGFLIQRWRERAVTEATA